MPLNPMPGFRRGGGGEEKKKKVGQTAPPGYPGASALDVD